MRPEEAAAICGREPGFVWLGMVDPSADELESMQDVFGLHELAVEDAQSFHLRPKVEQYDDGIAFVVLRTASDLHGARLRLEQRPRLLREGPPAALWAILDKVVDDYAPVVEELERDIEEVEQTVFTGAIAPVQRIY